MVEARAKATLCLKELKEQSREFFPFFKILIFEIFDHFMAFFRVFLGVFLYFLPQVTPYVVLT